MDRKTISQLWKKGTEIMFSGQESRFWAFVAELREKRGDSQVVSLLLEEYYFVRRRKPLDTLRVVKKVIAKTSKPMFLSMTYSHMAWALRTTGNLSGSADAAAKSLEFSRQIGKPEQSLVLVAFTHYFADDLAKAKKTLPGLEGLSGPVLLDALHANSVIELSMGNFSHAEDFVLQILKHENTDYAKLFGVHKAFEVLGMAKEGQGQMREAHDAYRRSVRGYLENKSTYTLFLLNKMDRLALLTSRLEFEPDKSILKPALALASQSPEAKIAIMERTAFAAVKRGDLEKGVAQLIKTGDTYIRSAQSLEGFILFSMAGILAKKYDVSGFWSALQRIDPLLSLYRAFATNHYLFKDFTSRVVLPLLDARDTPEPILRIRMFGGFEMTGTNPPRRWRSQKALTLFKYLLLNEKRGLQTDYLCWLIWPRSNVHKVIKRLYVLISQIRRNLGSCADLVVHAGDRYSLSYDNQLWVDVHEFQNLLRQAESQQSGLSLRTENYMRALSLYRGKLLPEDRYDRFIEEHRNYLHRRFREALETTVMLLRQQKDEDRALELAKNTYARFPGDQFVARTYIQLLQDMNMYPQAEAVYQEFRKELWRTHRKRPFFNILSR